MQVVPPYYPLQIGACACTTSKHRAVHSHLIHPAGVGAWMQDSADTDWSATDGKMVPLKNRQQVNNSSTVQQ